MKAVLVDPPKSAGHVQDMSPRSLWSLRLWGGTGVILSSSLGILTASVWKPLLVKQFSQHIGLAVLVGGWLLMLYITMSRRTRPNLPPGPKGWPIVGSLITLARADMPTWKKFVELGEIYGPIFHLRLGSQSFVVVNNAELAKLVLKDHDREFGSRLHSLTTAAISFNYKGIGVTPSSVQQTKMRKIIISTLLSQSFVIASSAIREQVVASELGNFLHSHELGKPIQLTVTIRLLIGRILLSLIFGYQVLPDEKLQLMIKKVQHLAHVGTSFQFVDNFPQFHFLDVIFGFERELLRLAKELKGVTTSIISDLKNSDYQFLSDYQSQGKKFNLRTMIQGLLAFEGGEKLDDEEITLAIMECIAGGTDTTSNVADWTMAGLFQHPEIMKKVRDEIDAVVGKERMVQVSDLPRLQYLDCVVKEILRLYPGLNLSVPHTNTKCNTTLGGYDIPRNTPVFVNIRAIQRDPKYYENPSEFNPDRFVGSDKTQFGTHFELLPYTSGRRGCPGMYMANSIHQLMVASFVHAFDWHLPDGMRPEDMDMSERSESSVSMSRSSPLVATCVPRLPLHLYRRKV